MRKIFSSHFIIVHVLYWEVREQPSVCELMTLEVNLDFRMCVINVVEPPFPFPSLSFESDRKRARHLDSDSPTYWQAGCGLVIEEPEDFVIKVY